MKTRKHHSQKKSLTPKRRDVAAPFIEHLYELRKRLIYCVLSVGVIAAAAYFVQQHLVNLLLAPSHGQQFIYTSPGGGISFLFKLCLYIGISLSLPVIAYQVLKYIEPLIGENSTRFIVLMSIACGMLALAGMAFGYFIGLPAALHFLLHQFSTKQIHALLSIQEYMSFVTAYMMGSAVLFQIPLILLFINRIKPLNPRRLFHYERWVIVAAFVASGLMNPTPEIYSQLAIAGPIILMYQVGIILIWRINKYQRRPAHVLQLIEQDALTQAQRWQAAAKSVREAVVDLALPPQPQPVPVLADPDASLLPEVPPSSEPIAVNVNNADNDAPEPEYQAPRQIYINDSQGPSPQVTQ